MALAAINRQANSSYLLDSEILARQLHFSKAWSYDKGDHILVTYELANNDLLSSILKNASFELSNKKVVFGPIQ